MEKEIRELKLARGILISEGKVLLAQDIRPGEGHYFLPGGSIEPGEPVRKALPREWMEELGWEIKVGPFLGCLESGWSYSRAKDGKKIDVFEINFLFNIEVPAELLKSPPTSREPHLAFSWMPISELSQINLLPEPLRVLIPDIANSSNAKPIWSSTLTE